MYMTFNIITLGCKVNAYESEFIKEQLLKSNFKYEKSYKTSDIVIVNTCSVTNMADNKSFKMIRDVRRDNPACIMVVCGCSAENHKDDMPDVYIDILIGNRDKSKIVSIIKEYLISNKTYVKFYEGRNSEFEDMKVEEFEDRTRAFIKIQDGCNNFCSYCIIPYVRGNIRSKDINKAIEEIEELVNNGHKEIVFTGIDTGNYGRETGKYNLVDLIRAISKFDKLERIRVSSIEITSIDDEFIKELKNNKKLCGHLHVSLQSGCDKTLKAMNRKYNTKEYLDKIKKIRKVRPDINLTTDVIVGFPGETEEDFKESVEFCKKVGFSKIHVFPYSKRKGTKAATMPDQVDNATKKERARELIKIDEDLQKEYYSKFKGEEVEVLIEEVKNGVSIGHTENFIKVEIKGKLEENTNYKVKVMKAYSDYVTGKVIK